MRVGKGLLREKTNVRVRAGVTMNSSGVYRLPYGKTAAKIGGRGESGTSPTGGNYAYSNEGTGGNYKAGGNARYNPTLYDGNSYTVWTSDTYGDIGYSYTDHPWGPATSKPANYVYYANGPGFPGRSTVTFFIENTYPSTATGNYNTTYYNPYYPGNDVYNAVVPGAAGQTRVIGGVTFPGGPVGGLAPVVATQISNLTYTGQDVTITVPPGGYVQVENV